MYQYLAGDVLGNETIAGVPGDVGLGEDHALVTRDIAELAVADGAALLVACGGRLHDGSRAALRRVAENHGLGSLHHGGVPGCDGSVGQVSAHREHITVPYARVLCLVWPSWLFLAHFALRCPIPFEEGTVSPAAALYTGEMRLGTSARPRILLTRVEP